MADKKQLQTVGTPDLTRATPPMGRVAVLKTSAESVLEEIGRVMELAGFQEALPKGPDTLLKINISWQHYYPACSTTPWQLDGVIQAMTGAGYPKESLIPAQNSTVVVDPRVGAKCNKHVPVIEKHGLEFAWLDQPEVEWVIYQPTAKMLCLPEIFPDGIELPRMFLGKNAIHLPTVKTHVFTGTTGAMKNAFGGLLNLNRHWTHGRIHETLVDLLNIQKEIHPGLFAVMDGTICGKGPGPRAMEYEVHDYLLASADQVAIDALAAKLMGFDPMKIDYIRLGHESGLGVGNPSEIEVLGDDISGENWGFTVGDTFASKGQKAIYHGKLHRFEHFLLRTPIVPWSFAASNVYHNWYWFPFKGKKRVNDVLQNTQWGRLFQSY